MNYIEFKKELYNLAEKQYQVFSSTLSGSNLPIVGIRIPILKKFVKDHYKDIDLCLNDFELQESIELTLCYLLIGLSRSKTFIQQMIFLSDNLKYAVDWILTDTITSLIKKSPIEDYIPFYDKFINSKETYVKRFGYVFLIRYYKDDKVVSLVDKLINDKEYYVMMAQAWLLATISITNFDYVYNKLKECNYYEILKRKTISKICDSFRITQEQKEIVKQLRASLR